MIHTYFKVTLVYFSGLLLRPFNDIVFKWFLAIMLRTYLFCFISASLNASSCCFCLLFIATEIIDDALIAPAPPGKEGYQKNKNYLKSFRFSSFSTLSSPPLSIHHFKNGQY